MIPMPLCTGVPMHLCTGIYIFPCWPGCSAYLPPPFLVKSTKHQLWSQVRAEHPMTIKTSRPRSHLADLMSGFHYEAGTIDMQVLYSCCRSYERGFNNTMVSFNLQNCQQFVAIHNRYVFGTKSKQQLRFNANHCGAKLKVLQGSKKLKETVFSQTQVDNNRSVVMQSQEAKGSGVNVAHRQET